MATVYPFRPYRYTAKAGDLNRLVTQPYDKISPEMQQEYLAASPYNIVRVILGERFETDTAADNVYTRAARYLEDWIAEGILAQDPEPAFYAYFQEFDLPGGGERVTRQGFIGLCALAPYSAGVIHRHERTLTGPKQDRTDLLNHTRAHCGQIFVVYPDPDSEVDRLLEAASRSAPIAEVTDGYGVLHRLWRIADAPAIARIEELMAGRKLVIADGHHRYETALAYYERNPDLPGAGRVMMTFVNIHSKGLKILATHRVVKQLAGFDREAFLARTHERFAVRELPDLAALKQAWAEPHTGVRIGAACVGGGPLYLLECERGPGELDVKVLHDVLLAEVLGIGEEAVREGALHYVRGEEAALELLASAGAPVAFLLEPTDVRQMADVAFSGGVMPQKSTDFYPKLLSGLAIYRVGEPS